MTGHNGTSAVDAGSAALWTLQQLVPDRGVSNAAVAIEMDGPVRWWPLQEALAWLARRHTALRTGFTLRGGELARRTAPAGEATLELDVVASDPETIETDLRDYAARPFRLESPPLVRVGLFTVDAHRQVICLAAHHIVVDAASLGVLVSELGRAYRDIAETDTPPDLPEPVEVRTDDTAALAYWRDRTAGFDPAGMRLDAAREVADTPTFEGGMVERVLSAQAVAALATLRKACRATDAIVLLACYYLVLRRLGAAVDQIVGVMADTRGSRAADAVGYHVATLPLRVRVEDTVGFDELVGRVTRAMVAGFEQGQAPFEAVAAGAGPVTEGPGWWRSRLVRQQFNFRPEHPTAHPAGEGSLFREVSTGLSRFDLELTAQAMGQVITVKLVYSDEVHDRRFAEAFLDRLDMVLCTAMAEPGRPVGDFPIRTRAESATVAAANATVRKWRAEDTVPALFAASVERAPTAEAVVDGSERVDYRRLAATAAVVRDRVVREGVAPGDVVALAAPRGWRTAAAVLGIWAAGAAYLPIDPAHPAERLRFQLDDAQCRVIVGGETLPEECCRGRICVPCGAGSDDGDDTVDDEEPSRDSLTPVVAPEDCAYLIYTSGSTGLPKGVRLSHGNLANLIQHFAAELRPAAGDAALWLTTFAFDISALELFLPLTTGGRVVVAADEVRADGKALLELIEREDVAVVQATPTTWRLVAESAYGRLQGRTVLCGGEPLPARLAEQLVATGARAVNVYGPTETTIWSTADDLGGGREVTVGTPIANTVVDVLDVHGEPLPTGSTGELCIGGAGVALGYHDRPDLTAERFRQSAVLGRHYRTGDLARWRADGRIELVGRADRQVKLRGHRIELGEVEAVLERHPEVRAACVLLRGDASADGYLSAFVAADDRPDLARDVWEHARAALPGYCVPARISILPELPTTANGKTDVKALERAPEADRVEPAPAPGASNPQHDALETELIGLWRSLLGRPRLDCDANFFLSGGHSLMAVKLAQAASERFGAAVSMAMVFRAPTPAAMAALLRAEGVAVAEPAAPGPAVAEPNGPVDGAAVELVTAAVREVSGLDVPLDAGFFASGMTSATAVTLHARLQRDTGRAFPVTDVFKHPTPRALAAYVAGLASPARGES